MVTFVHPLDFNDAITNMSLEERAAWLHKLMPETPIVNWIRYLKNPLELKGFPEDTHQAAAGE